MKDVEFENLKEITFEDMEAYEDKRTSAWYKWLKSSSDSLLCQMTNLRLCWNAHQPGVET